jgi:hypothetical protein
VKRTTWVQVRYMMCLVAVAAFYVLQTGATRAAMIDDCDQICDPTVPCEEQCWGPVEGQGLPILMTCGDFDGGVSGGMCDGCDLVCGPGTECERDCWDDGLTDCETFGECVACDDSYCAVEFEDRTSCPEDCGPPPPSCSCGNATCEPECGEFYTNCSDCAPPSPPSPCGDGFCDDSGGETAGNCPEDCEVILEGCNTCPGNWVCLNEVCVAPADIYVLPRCDEQGGPECPTCFNCVTTPYTDPVTGRKMSVCMPDWTCIF